MTSARLKSYAEQLRSADQNAFVRRVMWMDFEARLHQVWLNMRAQRSDIDVFGGAHMTYSSRHWPAYQARGLRPAHCLNSAQLTLGARTLRVLHALGANTNDEAGAKLAIDRGACAVFSQDVAGHVNIVFYPFSSDLAAPAEKLLVVFRGASPLSLSESRIGKYLELFFRYALATSSHRLGSRTDAWFRWRLWLLNLRYQSIGRAAMFSAVGWLLTFGVALLSAAFGYLALKP